MTWSEKNNPQGQGPMAAAYRELARRTGAVLCPVGEVWQAVRAAHPEEELYFADGEHSSVLGASLAGAVIGRPCWAWRSPPASAIRTPKP